MSQARDGSLPRRQFARTRSQVLQVRSTRTANEENIASGSQSTDGMSAKRRTFGRVGMPSRSGNDRVLQQRNSNRKESTRSQRFNLSDDDSDNEEREGEFEQDSQDSVDKLASQLFGGSKKGKGKASTQAPVAASPIQVKPEPQRSQSLSKPPAPPIDLTIVTTDDDVPPSSATQKSKSTSKSSISSSRSGLNGKKVLKKKKVRTQVIDKAKLQGMISGGSGKSENDSIVLLDTDEENENAVSRPGTFPCIPTKEKSSPHRNGNLSQPAAGVFSSLTQPKVVATSSHRSTLAAWRNAPHSSSSSRKLTQSDTLSSNASHTSRNPQPTGTVSSQPAPLLMCTQPPTSSPSKRQTMPHTSQTDVSTQENKRMQATLPAVLSDQESSDVDMDIDSSLPGDVQPVQEIRAEEAAPKILPGEGKGRLEVEVMMSVRLPSHTPVRSTGQSPSLLETLAKSPGFRGPSRTHGDLLTKTPIKSVPRTPVKTPATIPSDFNCVTPASSVLSEVSAHSALRVSQKASEIPVTVEQLDLLQDLCKGVPVTYSDGPDIQQSRNDLPGSATPRQAPTSMSSMSKALGTRDTVTTPRSQRSEDIFSDSSPRLSVPSSLPQSSHRDFFSVQSPSKRASMMRTWSTRPMPNSVHVMRHQNVLANASGKRKVPGIPIAEEPTRLESPAKRQHISPPEKPQLATPATPKPRARPKPVFATSSPRNIQIHAAPPLPASPARSIMTNPGSAPTTPSKSGSGIFTHPNTAPGSPMQEYDTDKSYVSSSVMEEKMPMLIPYQRLEQTALSQENFKMDVVDDFAQDALEPDTPKNVSMDDVGDESGDDLMALFGDFEWTTDDPQPAAKSTSLTPLSDVPVTKSIDEAEESLIDQVLQGSPSNNLSTDDASRAITSPNSDLDIVTDSTRTVKANDGGSGNKKALDMFAILKAKHEQEVEEKRKREEEVRKKLLEGDSDDDDSDDNLTSMLDKLKKPTTAIKQDDKGKGYALRGSAESTAQKPAARAAHVPYRATQLPAGFLKVTRDLKKDNNLKKSGMTAVELADMTLRRVKDEQEASEEDFDKTPSRPVSKQVESVQAETDWSGSEMDEEEEEENGVVKPKDPDAEDTALANIPFWQGVWEELEAEHNGSQTPIPDLATALPAFAPFTKKPRLLMAVLPNIIRKAETGNVPHYLIQITTTFPTHPVANAATRIFASHAPLVFEMSLWHAHLLRIRAKHFNSPTARAQATLNWLHCLLCVLKNPASLPSSQAVQLVVLLVKLSVDKRSDFAVRLAVLDCINESLKDLSEDQLMTIASKLAHFSEPYAARRMRQRMANVFGVISPQARALKIMFALQCLDGTHADVDKAIDIANLPNLVQHNSLSYLATTSDSPRDILSAVRMLIQSLTHTHDVIERVGNAGVRKKDVTMSEADARRSDWIIKRSAGSKWREEMLDSLRWLKNGMINKGKLTSNFRHQASHEITVFLNRFEQSSKYYLDRLRPPPTQVAGALGYLKVKSERATPISGSSVTSDNTRASSVLSEAGSTTGSVTAARPKPMRRVPKME
ncbi:hypothetical protein QFC21_007071 [Naganishia friedmannii]|uniref:Uncharacterized protein n=1 Tax=Naganishia friedmannii TaxID=89922 RepID=A0ACC2UYE3_9TREE|nr:hypothetical protein QFC21_007071 [Naganishia friedmannii]